MLRYLCFSLSAVALVGFTPQLVDAETIHVPRDYPTIQAGIDAAKNGDTVLIADGIYTGEGNRDISFRGKAITVRSESGPDGCVIDLEAAARGFVFENGETADSVVEGLSIINTNTCHGNGGGVCCTDGSGPTIRNCTIVGGERGGGCGNGGGVYCEASSPTIIGCTIRGNEADYGGGIYCRDGSEPTIADCLIIQNQADTAGGIRCLESNPTISNCVIRGNSADYDGGGLTCLSASPRISNTLVTGNRAVRGGGLYCYGGAPTIVDSEITWNISSDWGGGLYSYGSDAALIRCLIEGNVAEDSYGGGACFDRAGRQILTDCTITRNRSFYEGGGLYVGSCDRDNSIVIRRCTVTANQAGDKGGGLALSGRDIAVADCTISGNTAYRNGGGLHLCGNDIAVINCTISGNHAEAGGGMFIADGTPAVTNCTFLGNAAATGGAVYSADDKRSRFTNCILWGDLPDEIAFEEVAPKVIHCDVQGGWRGRYNIDADPLCAFDGDFHLMTGSPCIDGGANKARVEIPTTDKEGTLRPLDGDGDIEPWTGRAETTDIGAYEFTMNSPCIALSTERLVFFAPEGGPDPEPQVFAVRNCGGTTLFWEVIEECPWLQVDPSAGQSNGEIDEVTVSVDTRGLPAGPYVCGLDVVDPNEREVTRRVTVTLNINTDLRVPDQYATIQSAVDAAHPGDTVVVADGVYTGAGNRDVSFRGKPIVVRSENGPDNCIIDCEGGPYSQHRGFLFDSGDTAATVVDGFTVTNGHQEFGGGIRCAGGSSPTIRNCVITGNRAATRHEGDGDGGGIHCGAGGSPRIIDCTIKDNTTGGTYGEGGGVWLGVKSEATIKDSRIANNAAGYSGGGVHCRDASPTIAACQITGNTVRSYGGGVAAGSSFGRTTIADSVIAGNSGQYVGGGVYMRDNVTVVNCVIGKNETTGEGGGLHCSGEQSMVLNCLISGNTALEGAGARCFRGSVEFGNCTITENSAFRRGGGIWVAEGYATVRNSILWGNKVDEIYADTGSIEVQYSDILGGWPGEGNIDADPKFVDPEGENYRLVGGSPCIDAADNSAVPLSVIRDLDGNLRFHDDPDTPDTGKGTPPIVDMGAYEFGASSSLCSGRESLTANCRARTKGFVVTGRLSQGKPGATVTFRLNEQSATDRLVRINNPGKGRVKYRRLAAGLHRIEIVECDVYAETECR